jgi:hypothetical protein
MAGNKPFFISGAKAKIKVNNKTMAFCSDLSYSVQIITQTPKVLGMYEGTSVEPLGYNVSGSFTIIRYAKGAQEATSTTVLVTGAESGEAVLATFLHRRELETTVGQTKLLIPASSRTA